MAIYSKLKEDLFKPVEDFIGKALELDFIDTHNLRRFKNSFDHLHTYANNNSRSLDLKDMALIQFLAIKEPISGGHPGIGEKTLDTIDEALMRLYRTKMGSFKKHANLLLPEIQLHKQKTEFLNSIDIPKFTWEKKEPFKSSRDGKLKIEVPETDISGLLTYSASIKINLNTQALFSASDSDEETLGLENFIPPHLLKESIPQNNIHEYLSDYFNTQVVPELVKEIKAALKTHETSIDTLENRAAQKIEKKRKELEKEEKRIKKELKKNAKNKMSSINTKRDWLESLDL